MPLYDVDGELIGILGVGRDITDYKQAEEIRCRLENHVNQAEKSQSIGQLAGDVAHDFNNMLGAILGHVELALRKAAPLNPFTEDLK